MSIPYLILYNGYMNELKQLSKPAKVAAVKALKDFKYDYQEIADTLGISKRQTRRYALMDNNESWSHIRQQIQRIISLNEDKLLAQVVSKLRTELPDAKYSDAVEVYKAIKNDKNGRNSVNIIGTEMSVDFIATE